MRRASSAADITSGIDVMSVPSTTLMRASGAAIITACTSRCASTVPSPTSGLTGVDCPTGTIRRSGAGRPKQRANVAMSDRFTPASTSNRAMCWPRPRTPARCNGVRPNAVWNWFGVNTLEFGNAAIISGR